MARSYNCAAKVAPPRNYFMGAVLSLASAEPPLRPASFARFLFTENDLFSAGTDDPPLIAIARRFSGDMAAKPRRDFGFVAGVGWSVMVVPIGRAFSRAKPTL